MADSKLPEVIEELGIEVRSEFIPWSKSRNAVKDPKLSDYNLNWKVTLVYKGRDIITTDYGAGIAHCPSHKLPGRMTNDKVWLIKEECEKGRPQEIPYPNASPRPKKGGQPILPNPTEVVYSLVKDGDALDHATFEDWASDYGYDTDSRAAERIYRACLEIGLKLRAGLGEEVLRRLREAAQDY